MILIKAAFTMIGIGLVLILAGYAILAGLLGLARWLVGIGSRK